VVIQRPRCFAIYSGELLIGLIREMDRVPWVGQWSWTLSGARPNPPDFRVEGHRRWRRRAPRMPQPGQDGLNGPTRTEGADPVAVGLGCAQDYDREEYVNALFRLMSVG